MNDLTEFKELFIALNEKLKGKLHVLFEVLNGREISLSEPKILFPVIEEVDENDFIVGAIDSLTVKIGKAKDSDKFIIVPSESENDKKLKQQINVLWLKAKNYCKKYV